MKRSIASHIATLNEHKVTQRKRVPTREGRYCNCWGLTALILGWIARPDWLGSYEMQSLLSAKSRPVRKKEARVGDIIVFKDAGYLTHTAIITELGDDPVVVHKPGTLKVYVEPLSTILAKHTAYGNKLRYARPRTRRVGASA